jgi:hypothetical protein
MMENFDLNSDEGLIQRAKSYPFARPLSSFVFAGNGHVFPVRAHSAFAQCKDNAYI